MLCYLKKIINLGIVWGSDLVGYQNKYSLIGIIGYTNNSYIGDLKDKNSITGHCFFLDGEIVTWYSRQQWVVSRSTSKVKYIAVSYRIKKRNIDIIILK